MRIFMAILISTLLTLLLSFLVGLAIVIVFNDSEIDI